MAHEAMVEAAKLMGGVELRMTKKMRATRLRQ